MMEKGKRRFGNRAFWIVLAVVLALPAVFVVDFLVNPGPRPSLRKIERYASVEFPESARLLNSSSRTFLEIGIWAKVEMDPEDVDQFISSLPKPRQAMEADDIAFRFHHDFDWWNPSSLKRSRTVKITHHGDGGKARYWKLLVGLDDPRRAVVYLDYRSFVGST